MSLPVVLNGPEVGIPGPVGLSIVNIDSTSSVVNLYHHA
jgi:hypothetical protein